jgi:Rad3-related DNA helicase
MVLGKVIKKLQEYLDKAGRKKAVSCDAVDDLLQQLEEKRKKLEKRLEKEDHGRKRRELKLDLKIVTAELKRGKQRRKELRNRCKSSEWGRRLLSSSGCGPFQVSVGWMALR